MCLSNESNERPYFKELLLDAKDDIIIDENVILNKYIARYLMSYQLDGIKFLYKALSEQRGCILADEMGLGKTIQVIGFIAAVLNKKGVESDLDKTQLDCIKKQMKMKIEQTDKIKPFLIVCPAAIIDNWLKELTTWGYFSVYKYHSIEERKDTLNKIKNNRCEIVLTTHETCRDHIDILENFEWSAIIVDEFHKLKNEKSAVSTAFRSFKTKTRIGISGTILQNNLMELWSLLDWANPDCLGPKSQFKEVYYKPIIIGQRQNATKSQLNEKVNRSKMLHKLKENWILRRTKNIISNQLPKKKLSDFQTEIYKELLNSPEVNYLFTKTENCECGKFDLQKKDCCYEQFRSQEKKLNLIYLQMFLKLANHPGLILDNSNSYREKITNIISKYSLKNNSDMFFDINNCGKLNVLDTMLQAFYEKKAKVLLFSYSVKLLDILERFIAKKGYKFSRLDGNTKNSIRFDLVNEFNKNESIFLFLISTKAGGVGLNIVGANVVIIFDPNWNPTHDLQAQDRAFRIGQLRDVHVYRLISSGCIEESIYLRQIYKMHLNKECVEGETSKRLFILSEDNKKGEIFGIKNLFSLNDNVNTCLTRNILKRYTNMEKGVAGLSLSKFIDDSILNQELEANYDSENDSDIYDEESDSDFSNNEESYSDNEEPSPIDIGSLNQSLDTSINNILKISNVVHIHSNQDLVKTSKIESHLREIAKDELKNPKNNPNQMAYECDVIPKLNTLDYLELDQDDHEFTQDVRDAKQRKFYLENKKDTCVIYGQVPSEIRRAQFEQMAKTLNVNESELAEKIFKMSKEERFAKMKQFYLKLYPECREFYESFSKKKRKNKENNYNKKKKTKTELNDDLEQNTKQNKIDYYENISTFENVLNLIDEEPNDKIIEKSLNSIPQKDLRNEIDILFENFMNGSLEYQNNSKAIKSNEHIKSETSEKPFVEVLQNSISIVDSSNVNSSDKQNKDKYDQILDDIFNQKISV